MAPYVSITPDDTLEFVAPERKFSKQMLQVQNIGEKPVAFKVKTTSPKRYCVRPSSGVVMAKSTVSVEMSLLQKEMDGMTAGLTSDKFLIQTMLCDANFDPKAAKDEFKKPENKVQDLKLKVRLTYPSGSSAPKSGQSGKSAGGLASMMKVLMSLFMTLLVAVAVLVALHRTQPKLVKPVVQPLMKHVVKPYVLPALKMIEAHAKKAGILTKTGKLAKKW